MLKRLSLATLALAACGALQMANAAPLTLSLVPEGGSDVQQGGQITVDAVLSGLTSNAQILSAFDVSIDFDATVLQFLGGSTGNDFGGSIGFGPFEAPPGTVNLDLVSFELDTTLQGLQTDSVTLGSIIFTALTAGTSNLTYSFVDLTGLNAGALDALTSGATVNVLNPNGGGGGTPVPEPSMALMCLVGAMGMAWSVRRRKSATATAAA
jgi:hypothetical protein